METIRPGLERTVLGPLRRLVWVKEVPRRKARRRFLTYVTPLALLPLIGLGFAAGAYLQGNRHLPTAAVVLIAVGSVLPAALVWRRPILAWRLASLMLIVGVANAGPHEEWPWNPVQILCFFLVTARLAATQESVLTAWATGLSLVPILLLAGPGIGVGAAVLAVAIAALGDIVSRRRRTGELLAEQAEITEAERARRALLEERTRIAREMHDVVAHHMSMIAVRAETAPYRLSEELPEAARAELATIAEAARSALTDMRRLLGVLRSEADEAPTAPQPGLADVGRLITTARAAGLDVTVELADVGEVPQAVGLTAYRIVQEALTNAARHAPDGPVSISGRGFSDRLELSVTNPLPIPAQRRAGSGGHGLAGMRERVTLLGGTLTTGPSDGAFVVRAVLPAGAATPVPAPGPAPGGDERTPD